MKWIAAEIKPVQSEDEKSYNGKVSNRPVLLTYDKENDRWLEGDEIMLNLATITYLDESPSPSLQEVVKTAIRTALTYANNACVRESDELNADDKIEGADAASRCAQSIRNTIGADAWMVEEVMKSFAGWNARDSQQTAPILTRELYDTIWEAAQDRLAYDTADGKPFSYAPDKETFFTSLNL